MHYKMLTAGEIPLHRRGYEGISALWKKFGKLKSFQSFVLLCNQPGYMPQSDPLGKRAGSERHRPFSEKALSRRRSPTSKVITIHGPAHPPPR
jgi:hypothetical protein